MAEVSAGGASLAVRVARKWQEAAGIVAFELVAADGGDLPPFTPGAHVDVHVPGGWRRSYSLCNDAAERHRYQIAVLKEPASRGGSLGMHEQVQAGDMLTIDRPRNHFPLDESAGRSLLLAGGIGVTPLLSMAERLGGRGADFALHYCARTPQRMAFRRRIEGSAFAARTRLHFDDGPPAQRLDLAEVLDRSHDTHLYVCGPKGFMDAVLSQARAAGWPDAQVHHEYFSAEVATQAGDCAFEVKLASSGRVIPVAHDQSVVQALAGAGIEIPVSCEQGVCGTCLTRVLEGQPEHRDLYLTPTEQAANDQFLPCCSRARSARLLLDL